MRGPRRGPARRLGAGFALCLWAGAISVSPAPGEGLEPARGRLLVAARDLADPNFAETVVLLVDYDERGAMGLILNWPTAAPWSELLPELELPAEGGETVFVGGPVSRQLLLMLIRSEDPVEGAERVLEGVWFGASRDLLERLTAGGEAVAELRLYSGYAGWGAGQLDGELAAGGWLVLPGRVEDVFAADPDALWRELVGRGDVRWTRLPPPAERAAP